MQNSTNSSTNTSSVESQRELRIQKANTLRELGFDPYGVQSYRDYSIGFIKFWFDFVHKFDFSQLGEDEGNYFLENILTSALFPPSLLEAVEERLYMRQTARDMGVDPDSEVDSEISDYEKEILKKVRALVGDLRGKNKDQKELLISSLLKASEENQDETEMDGLTMTLSANQELTLCGRVKSKRASGKIAFVTLEDESCPEGFQLVFKKDIIDGSFHEKMLKIFDSENITSKLESIDS